MGCLFQTLLLSLLISHSLGVDVKERVDCFPEPGATQDACQRRGCIWEQAPNGSPLETPWCYFPPSTGYTVQSNDGKGNFVLTKTSAPFNPYGTDISPLNVKTSKIGGTVQVSIGTPDRYVPPVDLPKEGSQNDDSIEFQQTNVNGVFNFKIVRQSTGEALWDTSIGGMLFADKYIQIATYLPSSNIYGFGEHIHKKLKHDMTRYTTWPMLARDIGPDSASALSTQNLYGVHPFYLCIESDGKAHGVLILNSNAQEATLGPAPHLIYRTIGGQLDLAFFPGPTPEAVIQGYLAYIGRPFLPAYWALGYQLCRWGYHNLTDMQNIVSRVQAAGVPLDIVYADIDYMSHYEDFTEGDSWLGFGDYARQLHQNGLHVILIFDPAVEVDYSSFQRALAHKARFIEWQTADQVPHDVEDRYPMLKGTKIMLGNVWPERNTAFPDFLDTTGATTQWWIGEFVRFHNITPFDGMWIDMNEPSNFDTDVNKNVNNHRGEAPSSLHLSCPIGGTNQYDTPPYQTHAVFNRVGEYLCSKTLCMLGATMNGNNVFYNTKNLYGWSEARATSQAIKAATGKRGAVISRSTFVSSGRYAGVWLGDNTARWEDLQTSIIGAIEFNFFGLPYVGSDICGFNGVTNEELCLRWHQMGAFHSFSRNHNSEGLPPQDPSQWPSVALAAKIALTFRYRYLPYLYSLHYSASLMGGTVVRPLFFEFPSDFETLTIDYQFMWGSAIMIAPAVHQGVSTVRAYFPADRWYSLHPYDYGQQVSPGFNDVAAPNNSLTPVFVRGGYVLPRQRPSTTTTASRTNPFEILVTAASTPFTKSVGELYYDDGDTIIDDLKNGPHLHFQFTYNTTATKAFLYINVTQSTQLTLPPLDTVEVFGYAFRPDFTTFVLNGDTLDVDTQQSTWNAFKKVMIVKFYTPINMNTVVGNKSNILYWSHKAQ